VRLAAQFLQVGDVHQELRRRQPHVEAGEQALAAGERHRFAVRICEDSASVR
jgi:hypothetical protein